MPSPIRIGVLAEARYMAQSQPSGLIAELQKRGQNVTVVDPQKSYYVMGRDDWFSDFDAIVGRGRSWALLALLNWAERGRKLTINKQSAISAVHNKAQMSIALAASGLPIPQTFFGSIEYLSKEIPAGSYPIILKPIFGDNSQGLLVVNSPDEMRKTAWPEPVALAQRYFQTDGYDLKLYGIGDDIYAVRKKSPFNAPIGETSEGMVTMTDHLQQLGRNCGRLFGLDLFGVDCILTDSGPLVIEINDYPNYTNVPDANVRLANYVLKKSAESL